MPVSSVRVRVDMMAVKQRRLQIADMGLADGRWPETVVAVAQHFAHRTEIEDDDVSWEGFLDDLAESLVRTVPVRMVRVQTR